MSYIDAMQWGYGVGDRNGDRFQGKRKGKRKGRRVKKDK